VVDTVLGILLVLAVGMCLLAFPFVLWMLLGDGAGSRRVRYIPGPGKSGKTGSRLSENHEKAPPGLRRGWRVSDSQMWREIAKYHVNREK
jgi:hypothetical protein